MNMAFVDHLFDVVNCDLADDPMKQLGFVVVALASDPDTTLDQIRYAAERADSAHNRKIWG